MTFAKFAILIFATAVLAKKPGRQVPPPPAPIDACGGDLECDYLHELNYYVPRADLDMDSPCPDDMDFAKLNINQTFTEWQHHDKTYIAGTSFTATWDLTASPPYATSWTSSLSASLMLMHCGQTVGYYIYAPPVMSDPLMDERCCGNFAPGGPKYQAISFVAVCRPKESMLPLQLEVSTNGPIQYSENRVYDWMLTKTVSATEVIINPDVSSDAPVNVTIKYSTGNYVCTATIAGTVTVHNPSSTDVVIVASSAKITADGVQVLAFGWFIQPGTTIGAGSTISFTFNSAIDCVGSLQVLKFEYVIATNDPWCGDYTYPNCGGVVPPWIQNCIDAGTECGGGACGGSGDLPVSKLVPLSGPCMTLVDYRDTSDTLAGCDPMTDAEPTIINSPQSCIMPPVSGEFVYTYLAIDLIENTYYCDTAKLCRVSDPQVCLEASAGFHVGEYIPPPPSPYPGCTYTLGYWKNHAGVGNGHQENYVKTLLKIDPAATENNFMVMASHATLVGCRHGIVWDDTMTLTSPCYEPNTLFLMDSATINQYLGANGSPVISDCPKAKNIATRRQLFIQLLAAELNLAAIWTTNIAEPIPLEGLDLSRLLPPALVTAVHDAHYFLHTYGCSNWQSASTDLYSSAPKKTWLARASELNGILDNWNSGLSGYQPHCGSNQVEPPCTC